MTETDNEEDIRCNGFQVVDVLAGNLRDGDAAVVVRSHGGAKALLLVFSLRGLRGRLRPWLTALLKHCSLCHPHLATLQSIFRTRAAVCLKLQHCNGGCVFSMVARAGAGGLPLPAAVFLLQQAVLAVEFLHGHREFLHRLTPQALRANWNDSGVPILRIVTVPFPKPHSPTPPGDSAAAAGAREPAVVTMWTAPQLVRAAASRHGASPRFYAACDVWALAVVAFFLLRGAWPFTKEVIAGWADTAAEDWASDAAVRFTGDSDPPGSDGQGGADAADAAAAVRDERLFGFLQDVFAGGGLPAAEFAERYGDVSLFTRQPWFQKDLPDGAASMTETYREKTEQRRASPEFARLSAIVQQVLRDLDENSL